MWCWVWNENGGKRDVGILIGVHEVYEPMRVGSSRVVSRRDSDSVGRFGGDDWRIKFKEGGILIDSYE